MDGDFSAYVLDNPWVRQSFRAGLPKAGVPGRISLFLQRDLNDEALSKPAEPWFGQSELAAARQEGFDAGRAAGIAAAAGSQAAYRTAAEVHALGIIAAAMNDGSAQAAHVADTAAAALAKALVASMGAVMPDLIRRTALSETGAMLSFVLPGLAREPTVRVELPHEIADSIDAILARLAPEHHEKILVVRKDDMRPGEASVHWTSGHARREPAQIWRTVMEALHPALDAPQSEDSDNGE